MAGIGLVAALAAGNPATAALRGQAAHPGPAVVADQADHWGSFFGGASDLQLSPVPVSLPGPVVQIGTSNSAQYALLANGQVWAWGQGTDGQLGDGGTTNSFTTAVQVQFPPGIQIAFLATDAMPYNTALAVDTSGNAWGWGYNKRGELCLGSDKLFNRPVQLPFTDVTTLAGARGHALYDSNGTVYACGDDSDGVLGDGSSGGGSEVPVTVSGLDGQSVIALVAAWENAGALLANGTYLDWGYDAHGQVGDGKIGEDEAVPVHVPLPGAVTQVAQGGSTPSNGQTIVMLSNGSLYAWGSDKYSQLGDGHRANRVWPERIFAPAGVTYATLASAGATSYAISTSGDVYAWGYNGTGEVGDGNTTVTREPIAVDSGASVISATAGDVAVAVSASSQESS